jgi:hypothetical protein
MTDGKEPTTGAAPSTGQLDDLLVQLAALQAGDPIRISLRQHVVESQLPLVHHLAQRFRGRESRTTISFRSERSGY